MVFSNNLLAGAGGQATGYDIEQSILFNSGDSAAMTRSFGTPTDQNKFTYAFWIKSTKQQNGYNMGINVSGGVTFAGMVFNGGNMAFYDYTSGSANIDVRTTFTSATGKFQDYSTWYHAMFVYDSDQGTDSNRLKFYINGTQFPAADLVGPSGGSVVWPGSGANSKFNASGTTHRISDTVNGLVDGYMAEIYFIDGQALNPTSFGKVNSTTGQFVPIEYSGTFGNNGFYINGSNSSDLGEDFSGNNNDFTTSNLAAADQVPDTPTSNADSAIGNRATLISSQDGSPTMSEGNTRFSNSGGTRIQRTTNQPLVGKTYWEVLVNNNNQNTAGVSSDQISTMTNDTFYNQTTLVAGFDNANFYYNGSFTTYSQPSNSQRWMFAYDADTGELWSGVNGTWHNSGNPAAGTGEVATLSTSYKWFPFIGGKSNADQQIIWGASNMSHTVPTGFTADLSSYRQSNPTIADPSAYFQPTTYTGDGSSSHEINQDGNSTFEPTMVWIKSRSAATDHVIQDQVRGNFVFYPNQNSAEGATGGGWVSSFDSDGFTVNVNGPINASGETFAAWQWKAGSSSVSNTDGDITSTVRADSKSGVSVLTYSGNGSDNQEIGHGIGIAPKMIITKRRDSSGNWTTYHDAVGINKVFYLNSNAAVASNTEQYRATPTSSVYTVGVGGDINNSSGTYAAYVFAEVEGFSKISSYTGNGSTDGPFVYTGFKPAFVIFKNISAASQSWEMFDNKRDGLNDANRRLYPNTNEVEPAASDRVRLLSNGFKIVTSGGTHVNGSGNTIIYMAFAKSPFKTTTAFGIES